MGIAIFMTMYIVSNFWITLVYKMLDNSVGIGETTLLLFGGLPMLLWAIAEEL